MSKVTLSKDSLTVPTIIFNNGVLSSDESGNLTWNGQQVGGGTLDASGDITFTGLDAFTQYVTFNGGMISNGDIILNGSKLLLANGASVELYTGDGVPLPEGGVSNPGTGNSGESIDTSNFFKLDTNNTIKGHIHVDKSSLNTFTIGYPWADKMGALLSLRSVDYETFNQQGTFALGAINGENEKFLVGYPNGKLTWSTKEVVTTDFLNDINWDSDITKDPYIGINNSKVSGPYIYFIRGDSATSAGSLELSARNATSASKTLKLNADGTLTWCGKNVLTEGSVKSSVTETWKNGTSWYRKYSDGWIEQGGYINSGSTGAWKTTVSLHKAYTSASTYNVILTIDDIDPNGDRIQNCGIGTYNKTSSSFSVGQENSGSPYASWYACGY